MPDQLRGQTAIVVGASSGMGRAIAVTLAREGAHVVAAARRAERLVELEQLLLAEGCSIETCVMDVAQPDDVRRWLSWLDSKPDALS